MQAEEIEVQEDENAEIEEEKEKERNIDRTLHCLFEIKKTKELYHCLSKIDKVDSDKIQLQLKNLNELLNSITIMTFTITIRTS